MKRIFRGKSNEEDDDDNNVVSGNKCYDDDDQIGKNAVNRNSRRNQADEYRSVVSGDSGGNNSDPSRRAPGRRLSGGNGGGTVTGDRTFARSSYGEEQSVDPSAFITASGVNSRARPSYRDFLSTGGLPRGRSKDNNYSNDGSNNKRNNDPNNPGDSKDDDGTGGNSAFLSGTNRLNRILQNAGHAGGLDGFGMGNDPFLDDDDLLLDAAGMSTGMSSGGAGYSGNPNSAAAIAGSTAGTDKFGTGRIVRVTDPTDLNEVAAVCARYVVPPLKVDPCSIGGSMLDGYPETMLQETLLTAACSNFESTGGTDTIPASSLQYPSEYTKHKRALGLFAGSSNKGRSLKRRYVIVARSTNKPLLGRPSTDTIGGLNGPKIDSYQNSDAELRLPNPRGDGGKGSNRGGNGAVDENGQMIDESERADYDAMFAPDGADGALMDGAGVGGDLLDGDNARDGTGIESSMDNNNTPASSSQRPSAMKSTLVEESKLPAGRVNFDILESEQEEVSSFPVLICMTLNQDGTAPDIRKLISLDQLTTVQDLHSTVVQLAFNNGDTIRLDFGGNVNDKDKAVERSALDKERFVWSLLQIHAILCMAVVERNSIESANNGNNLIQVAGVGTGSGGAGGASAALAAAAASGKGDRMFLPPLNVRNLDRAELQYVATVNGFLRKSKLLCALLERQRTIVDNLNNKNNNQQNNNNGNTPQSGGKKKVTIASAGDDDVKNSAIIHKKHSFEETKMDMEAMEEMAYDLMMGNFATRVTLFQSEEERLDAEEILNSDEWTNMLKMMMTGLTNTDATTTDINPESEDRDQQSSAAINVAHILGSMLQGRMRDLEAETCRRLIAWEDEKTLSVSGNKTGLFDDSDDRDTVDALALASLFKTLEALDSELLDMENWLQDRAAAIKPLTDDCADIEEENRQLEQQWKSYDMLGAEMRRLLQGLEINEYTEKTLNDPASALSYHPSGSINVEHSEEGIEKIYQAGKALLDAIEYPKRSGGMHLKSVSERAKGLATISHGFSSSLAQVIVTVMEQFKADVVTGSDNGKVSKSDTHSMIAKKIRDTQRKFQSALLGYIKLIEILAALSPDMLPALRDAYAEMVSEGILMKKRMKGYFQALPAKNAAHLSRAGKELKDYVPFADPPIKVDSVNAPDIRAVLSELLPVIAREAYFTSALFGSNKKELDGREKKRNFENAKNAVDMASAHFRYYVNRTCGIVESEANRAVDLSKVDPMLCLVATIYLNEAMDNYIDREKKGGDHSLSLAYVRATILDLRKKADKQWVAWVEKQIEWIKTHDGVPPSGKRAGVFSSFSRFPKYLDHLIQCCSEGRDQDYVPDLAGIKVINYYLQKMAVNLLESLKECANRDSTEKTYATNVMKMENTYYFTQCIKQRGEVMSKLFSKQVMKANAICKESTDAYLGWMIKREFTALHELFSRVSKARKEHGDREVIKHVPKDQFVKILQKEASREVLKEKIGAMFSRMEKHVSEEGGLLIVAWKALVKVLYEWFGRWEKLCTSIYQHKIDPSAVDVVRIAKAAGGGGGGGTSNAGGGGTGSIAGVGVGGSLRSGDGGTMSTNISSGGLSGMDDPHQLGEFAFKSILALGSGGGQSK